MTGFLPTHLATPADARVVAGLLDDFNREFATPTPGVEVLTSRLLRTLAGDAMFGALAGDPAVALALVSLRPNAWYEGPVALLDELYVAPRHRNAGIGSALLNRIEAEARARGCELVEVNVDAVDVDARRFYERHGYRSAPPGTSDPSLYYYRDLDQTRN